MLLLAPCNSSKKATASVPTVNDNSEVVITLQTGACFGKCPVYLLTINGKTKTATYKGQENTDRIGNYSKPITDAELTQMVNAFETAKFNSLNDEYLGEIVDFPIKTITYTNKGKTKKIRERSGAPEALTSLEKTLNEFADSEGWKKAEH
jgi:hypothetical protein